MFKANVYKIMIGAPSDIDAEINIAFDVIQNWNNINAQSHNIVLLPSHWSINAYPTLSHKPQDAIDRQLVDKSDMLICIFGSKLGTPTDNYISGTVEEIEEHLKAKKEVMVFFCSQIDKSKTNLEQTCKLLEFQKEMYKRGLCSEYADAADFKSKLTDKLALCVNENFFGYREDDAPTSSHLFDFDEEETDALKHWVASGNDSAVFTHFIGGTAMLRIGNGHIDLQNNQEVVKWTGFFAKLIEKGLAEIVSYDKHNKPRYRLKEKAYIYFNS